MSAELGVELQRVQEMILHAEIVARAGIGVGAFPTLEESLDATEQSYGESAKAAYDLIRQHGPALGAMVRERDGLRAAGLRVTAAFRAMGVARQTIDHFRCQQECEAAMTALDATLEAK